MSSNKHSFSGTEIKAGLMVLASVAVFLIFFAAVNGYRPRAEVTEFHARFKDTLGLNKGAAVRFGGAKVGRVTRIQLEPAEQTLIRVLFEVTPDVPVNADSIAYVGQVTLTAEKHLEITTGTPHATRLEPGAAVPVREGGLLDQAGEIAGAVRETLESVKTLLGVGDDEPGAARPLITLRDLFADADKTINSSTGLVEDARAIVADSEDDVSQIFDKIQSVEDAAHELVTGLNGIVDENRADIRGSLAQLRQVLEKIDRVAAGLDAIADTAESALANTDALTGTAKQLLEGIRPDVEDTILDLRETVRYLNEFSRTIVEQPQAIIRGTEPKGRRSR